MSLPNNCRPARTYPVRIVKNTMTKTPTSCMPPLKARNKRSTRPKLRVYFKNLKKIRPTLKPWMRMKCRNWVAIS
eukprot:3052305-Amphidinium_carterae.1